MKLLLLAGLLALSCAQIECQGLLGGILGKIPNPFGFLDTTKTPCNRDALPLFKAAVNDFSIRLTKRASFYSNDNFVISPYSIWLSLAALAEYADGSAQREIFKELGFPEERCIRDQFYKFALGLETSGPDVIFERYRAFAIDESVEINRDWIEYIESLNILKLKQLPYDIENFESVYNAMGVSSEISLKGHSIMLDRLDYGGIWTSAFAEGKLELAPFYDDLGQNIAQVEYMTMKSKVRFAYIPIIDAKVLELPVGTDGRYTMLLTMGVNNHAIKGIMELLMSSIIVDIMSTMTQTLVPIEVAVPRFSMRSGYDMRPILEDLDIVSIFRDPTATRLISNPAAQPGAFLQSVFVNVTSASFGTHGRVRPTNLLTGFLEGVSEVATGVATAIGRDFKANRPFFFTLIDTKTQATIFTGVYSNPHNSY